MDLFGKLKGDKIIWIIVFILFAISFLLVFSCALSIKILIMHTIHLFFGFLLIKIASKIPYKYFTNFSFILFITSVLLLVWAILTPSYVFDDYNNQIDASRWINIFGFTFQPSELAKFSLILLLARNLSLNKKEDFTFTNSIVPIFLPILLVFLLTIKSNASTALIIFFVSSIVLFISHFPFKQLLKFWGFSFIFFVFSFLIILTFSKQNRIQTWKNRIVSFVNPENSKNYQFEIAQKFISSAGWFGVGAGKGSDLLPAADSDFIYTFSILEYGLIMGLFILFLYLFFFQRIISISRRIKFQFPYLVVLGLGTLFVAQALINMGVNLGLLPTTGQTLPLLSRGGSSIWVMSLSIGIILNISSVVYEK
tara:strand:- start:731 stop:1831 length:1101 start_codon:yes stop_codon:yes gene_type:complete